jgi:hypothetical protein
VSLQNLQAVDGKFSVSQGGFDNGQDLRGYIDYEGDPGLLLNLSVPSLVAAGIIELSGNFSRYNNKPRSER